jgi:uncharacterized protein
MELHEEGRLDDHRIRSFAGSELCVGHQSFRTSLLGASFAKPRSWEPASLEALRNEYFAELVQKEPEIILLGTGIRHVTLHPGMFRSIHEAGIGFEAMSTLAACRTYNVLLADGRRVLACLFLH